MLKNNKKRTVALILTLALIAGTMASFTGCSTYSKTEPTETTVTTFATTATADETTTAETSASEVIETVTETVVVTDPKTGETTVQVIEKPISSNTQKNEPAENKTNSSNTSNSSNKKNTGSSSGSSSSSGSGTQTKPSTGSGSQSKPVNKPTTKPTTKPATPKPTEPKVSPYDERASVSNVWLVEDRVIYYLNKYRSTPLTSLNNDIMGDYATYRSQQLVYNFSHNDKDEREAAGALKFGIYHEIEESYWDFEKDESVSTGKILKYYEPVVGEAIGKLNGVYLETVDGLAERIVLMFYNSSGHWSYIGNSGNIYGAVGITFDGDNRCFVSVCVSNSVDGKG